MLNTKYYFSGGGYAEHTWSPAFNTKNLHFKNMNNLINKMYDKTQEMPK